MANSLFRKKSLSTIISDAEHGVTDGHGSGKLKKILGVRDLTAMGIAAVIGAGIFSTIGQAACDGGPGVIFLFLITAVTCGFTALCYAEFASRVPVAGSAYTYSYVTFGEVIAWVLGWALILEYSIGNVVVSISWSSYFVNLLEGMGFHLPLWLGTDPTTAETIYNSALAAGRPVNIQPGQWHLLLAVQFIAICQHLSSSCGSQCSPILVSKRAVNSHFMLDSSLLFS